MSSVAKSDELPVDVSFPLKGLKLPFDHGFCLYSALSRLVPAVHQAPWFAVLPIRGERLPDSTIRLGRGSRLNLRVQPSRIAEVLPLVGARLELGGYDAYLGSPELRPLRASNSLDAKLVVIKMTNIPLIKGSNAIDKAASAERFEQELRRQLAELRCEAQISLTGRGEIVVHGKRVIGWSVRLSGLSSDDSLLLQSRGLGGKQRMGCGMFEPTHVKS